MEKLKLKRVVAILTIFAGVVIAIGGVLLAIDMINNTKDYKNYFIFGVPTVASLLLSAYYFQRHIDRLEPK